MRRLSGIIICLLLSLIASAQTITQKGVAYQYNGKNNVRLLAMSPSPTMPTSVLQ